MIKAILLGPPGSGKGTQASFLVKKYSIPHISTGDILRAAVKEGTAIGMKAKSYMDKGDLVPDEVIVGIIKDRLQKNDCKSGFLLDGFPRTMPQADSLDAMLTDIHAELDHVLYITVDDQELVKRLLSRADIEGRSDDNLEIIKKRIKVYKDQTLPLVGYYKFKKVLHEIDGIGAVEEITKRITAAL